MLLFVIQTAFSGSVGLKVLQPCSFLEHDRYSNLNCFKTGIISNSKVSVLLLVFLRQGPNGGNNNGGNNNGGNNNGGNNNGGNNNGGNNNNNGGNRNGCEPRTVLPSARTISHAFHTDLDIPSTDVTHMVTQWGQFLDHDITATPEFHEPESCCSEPERDECYNIPVGTDSFYNPFDVTCLSVHRSEPFCEENGETREHFNINTHFVDASNVYGHNDETAVSLREQGYI